MRGSEVAIRCYLFVGAMLLLHVGCGEEDNPVVPSSPPFSAYWPNSDSSSWTFAFQEHQAADSTIASLAGLDSVDVDSLDFEDLEDRIMQDFPASGDPGQSTVGTLRTTFSGMVETPLAGQKQNLVATLDSIPPAFRNEPFSLLKRIYWARPDLRTKMVAKRLIPPEFEATNSPENIGPIYEGSHYFEKKSNWIGYYGDLNADSSYTIAIAPLAVGAEFRHQLVPDLADDIWEYGWVAGTRTVVTPAGTFRDAVRVIYFFDFGLSLTVDEQGDTLGTFRSYTIASLDLAPNVGPVYQRAKDLLFPGYPWLGIEDGAYFSEAKLTGYNIRP